jgi:EpsI family protein
MNHPAGFMRNLLIGTLLCAAAALATAIAPTRLVAANTQPDLGAIIPQRFGDWTLEPAQPLQIVDPTKQAEIDKLYAQVLMRAYVDSRGSRIMLSIAYGRDQRDNLAVHRPEVCYPAQGAQLLSSGGAMLDFPWGQIPARRLVTQFGARHEPVTYWIMVGHRALVDPLPIKLEQLRYGLRGRIPDGFLVRVSSIDPDDQRAFADQARFLTDLLGALPPADRQRLSGLR